MAVPHHLDDAVERLRDASLRIETARARPTSPESLREWLEALTDYVQALSEAHEYTNESIHEKLHALAGAMGLKEFPRAGAPAPSH